MIKGTEKVRQFLVFNKTPFWNIKRSDSSPIVFSSTTVLGKKEDLSLDEGLRYFDDCQFLLEPGHYFIEAWTKDTPTNNRFKDQVIIGNEKTATSIGSIGTYSEEQVQAKIQEGIDKYVKDLEIKSLHKRLEELEKNDNDQALASFLNKVEPYLQPMLSGLFGGGGGAKMITAPASAISGINDNTNTGTMDAQQEQAKQRFHAALNKWNGVEPNILEIVEKIADMAAKKDPMYMMVKSQLLKKG